ncbi:MULTISPECIES: group II truncated hemoglobin [Hydrocarboniphaga]|jgi:hemoglobin|uniref:Protozoan/cyanobacterial globin family protein n=1 Tax=Hydrocarboniphaga effusa AP103 TaxID=1172194 RepID=I8T7U5_9GAMM|nr:MULTISPECIES: group II truncated hemoglobin [Hydrocarboniphaga]EIT69828.1 protozoan/cyanobacterial globin family protein [Hydrocarboniphaga effusa AP103]MDZ4078791.1 group II truncated hemoglobin [Hydrocarboniphaga sp.]
MTDSSDTQSTAQAASETTNSAPRLFDLLGGEPGVRRLVDAFYDRMDHEPAYAGIRALHPPTTEGSRNKFFWFLCGWSGGPDHFVARFGHPRLRARHLPFAIGSAERDQWLHCMQQALVDIDFDPVLADRLLASFFQTADWMRNKPD